jgi:hypothetical protein
MTLIAPPPQHDLLLETKRLQYPGHHQIDRYGEIVGIVQISNGAIVDPAPSNVVTRKVIPWHVEIPSGGRIALKDAIYYCDSVQIQSARSDMTDNVARIGVGNTDDWGNVIEPGGGILSIDSPVNGVLDLSKIFIYGTPGDQVSLLIME